MDEDESLRETPTNECRTNCAYWNEAIGCTLNTNCPLCVDDEGNAIIPIQ